MSVRPQQGFSPTSEEAFPPLTPDDEKELPIPGPEEAAGAARALILGAGKHEGGCVLLGPPCRLLPWVPGQGGPRLSGSGPAPPDWVSRSG